MTRKLKKYLSLNRRPFIEILCLQDLQKTSTYRLPCEGLLRPGDHLNSLCQTNFKRTSMNRGLFGSFYDQKVEDSPPWGSPITVYFLKLNRNSVLEGHIIFSHKRADALCSLKSRHFSFKTGLKDFSHRISSPRKLEEDKLFFHRRPKLISHRRADALLPQKIEAILSQRSGGFFSLIQNHRLFPHRKALIPK